VTKALRQRLDRVRTKQDDYAARIRRLQDEIAALPVVESRSPDEIIGYDEHGLPS